MASAGPTLVPRRAITVAAATVLLGTLISGPIGVALVLAAHPQPAWQDAGVFARAYHPVQLVPHLGGMLLVGGFVALLAGLHAIARAELRIRTTMALMFGGAFAAVIITNYAIQTTLVPSLAIGATWSNPELLASLTMTNPRSLGWTLEMWGYALLGIATWLCAPVLVGNRAGRTASGLFIINGMLSLAGALTSVASPGWMLRPVGLVVFAMWNALIVAMMVSVLLVMRSPSSAVMRRVELSPAPYL